MIIERVSSDEYKRWIDNPSNVFNSVEFNELNGNKCNDLHYLLYKDGKKVRFGLIAGMKGECLMSPFSAPFGGFESRDNNRLEYYNEMLSLTKDYVGKNGGKLFMTLPPAIYEKWDNVNKIFCVSQSEGVDITYIDYNYHYPLERFDEFEKFLSDSSKRNFKRGIESGLEFTQLPFTRENLERVYNVIKINHTSLGYPVKMSVDDIMATSKIVEMYLFTLTLGTVDVATALFYHTAREIIQLIYWGDLREYSALRPMNLLAYRIFEIFRERGFRIVDLGPASEDGIPAYGLCNFKESLGCELSSKISMTI